MQCQGEMAAHCGGHPCSPPQLCPHAAPMHSSASLPPGNSAGKRQETDVVLICAQLLSTVTSTPSEAPQQPEVWEEELLCPAGPAWCCMRSQPRCAPDQAAGQGPGCHSTFDRLVPGLGKLRAAALIPPAKQTCSLALSTGHVPRAPRTNLGIPGDSEDNFF